MIKRVFFPSDTINSKKQTEERIFFGWNCDRNESFHRCNTVEDRRTTQKPETARASCFEPAEMHAQHAAQRSITFFQNGFIRLIRRFSGTAVRYLAALWQMDMGPLRHDYLKGKILCVLGCVCNGYLRRQCFSMNTFLMGVLWDWEDVRYCYFTVIFKDWSTVEGGHGSTYIPIRRHRHTAVASTCSIKCTSNHMLCVVWYTVRSIRWTRHTAHDLVSSCVWCCVHWMMCVVFFGEAFHCS